MITRDEWDKLTPNEKWKLYRAAHFGGFSLSDVTWTKGELKTAAKMNETIRKQLGGDQKSNGKN